jgi:hypothetical protein
MVALVRVCAVSVFAMITFTTTTATARIVRPGAFPRTVCTSLLRAVLGVVLLEATMIMLARTHANSILLTMAATMVAVARVLLPGHNHTRLLSSSDRLFARFLRR